MRLAAEERVFGGEVVRTDVGWAIRRSGEGDEPLWPFHLNLVRPGGYVALLAPDDVELVCGIASVNQA